MSTRSDLVRVRLDNGAEASVGAAFAESHNLKPLKRPAVDGRGRALPTTYPVELKGKALDDALESAGLEKAGSADEKRQRLADHQASGGSVPPADTTTNTGGASAPNQ